MKRWVGRLAITAALALAACGGNKDKPPLTPDGPETETGDAGASTLPHPDPK